MFEPDGLGTSGLFWAAGLLLLVLVAVLGHRIGSRGWKHALARAGSVAITALCLVLGVTATLNHTYGWYTSWSDLTSSFTGDHPAAVNQVYGAPPASVSSYDKAAAHRKNEEADKEFAQQRAQFTAALKLQANAPKGQWVKFNVPGQTVKGHDIGRVMAWLPPGYGSKPLSSYPVIEAFHGMPGGTLDYKRVFFLDDVVQRAHAEHKLDDAVIIVPQEMPAGMDTECVDGGGINEETWLTKIVPDFVVKNMYVQADSHSWATLGVSAGGWCSTMAGMLHPDRYAAIVSLGGYFKPEFAMGWNPFAGKEVPERYDLLKRAREHPTHQAIWLLISGGDKLSGTASADFAKAVRPPNVLTAVDYPGAGHRIDVWQRALPDVMTWLGKTLPAFAWSDGASASAVSPSSSSPNVGSGSPVPATPTPGASSSARLKHEMPAVARTRG